MSASLSGFHRLLVSEAALNEEHGQAVTALGTRAGLPVITLPDDEGVLQHPGARESGSLLVLVSPEMGWIKKAEHGLLAVRRGEHYLNPIVGCQFGCTYCYLLAMPHDRRPLRFHVSVAGLLGAIDELVGRTETDEGVLFCTGELADSLEDIDLFPVATLLVEHLGKQPRVRLELRTKSDRVAPLLPLAHRGRTTVGFSLAPQEHVRRHEPGTPSIARRINAARQCQEAGYPVALKLEPVLLLPDWEKHYANLLEQVANGLQADCLDHVSVGCLRWSEDLAQEPAFARSYGATVQSGTWIEYRPGKKNGTVSRLERAAAYEQLLHLLREHGITAPIWWSLEEPDLIHYLEGLES